METPRGYAEAISQLFHEKYKTLYNINSVPTSNSDLSNIKNTLVERLHLSEVSNLDHVTPDLICHCIEKLKPGKGDGSEGFRSDHLINADKSLNVLLSLLFRAIVIHGHYPRNTLVSTIISIPKDLKPSLCNVDNYKGISLFNSIVKVFDYVIIELCNDQLIATDMQYDYKDNHSTTLCSIMYLETLQYYRNCGSKFSVVCLTPQRRLMQCIMESCSIFCCLRIYLFVLFVCHMIVLFVKNQVPFGVLIIPIILQCPLESNKGEYYLQYCLR